MWKQVWRHTASCAFLMVYWLVSPPSFAYQATYQGLLISSNPVDAPIPIIINLEVNLGRVSGDVATAMPREGRGVVIGNESVGTCDLRSLLGGSMVLKMKGACSVMSPSFVGKYSLLLKDGKTQVGTFRLSKTRVQKGALDRDSPGGRRSVSPSRSSATRCISAHGACLLSCPRGDYNAEFLCANQCKKKLGACKAQARTTPSVEKRVEQPAPLSR